MESIEKPIEIEKKLTIDWQSSLLVQTANSHFDFMKKLTPLTCQFKQSWRLPWEMLDDEHLYKMQYHVTINPDPEVEWFTSGNDLKLHNSKFREFLTECKKETLYKNIIVVYEYGTRGREYGKLHWHILLSTNKINKFIEMAISLFGTKKKSRWTNTVVKKAITIDKKLGIHATDEEKVENYRDQINYIMKEYMKKESQNKKKCLYTNMVKKNI